MTATRFPFPVIFTVNRNQMTSPRPKTIKTKTQTYRDEFLSLCETLVEFETPSDRPDCFPPAWDFLMDAFEDLGFTSRLLTDSESGGHLYLRPESRYQSTGRQLFLGHLDTVWDVGTLANTPFQIEDRTTASGPGLFDMKAGIAQLLVAFRIMETFDQTPELTPIILLNSDEEIGSPHSSRYIRCLARRVDRCFVLEPSMAPNGAVKTARKGVGHFTISIEGRASHAGISPEKGSSAILELSHVIQALNQLNDPSNGITVNVGVIEGGTRSNVVPEKSQAEVDVRVKTKEQATQLEQQIHTIEPETEGVTLTVSGGFRRPPMEFNDQNQQLWKQVKSEAASLEIDLDHTMSGGASDGNTANQFTPTIDGLGPVGDGAHETYEYIDIEQTLERTALLITLILSGQEAVA